MAIGLCYVLYAQIIAKDNIADLQSTFLLQLSTQQIPWLLGAMLLMPLNWALETEKWRKLIRSFENLSFGLAFKAVISGVTLSMFTPNRIGEYGGRILYVSPENNWKAVIATLVGSFSQLLILLSCGLVGLFYFSLSYLVVDNYITYSILAMGIGFISLLLFCFFNIELIIPIARKIPWPNFLNSFIRQFAVLKRYDAATLFQVLKLSFLRYLVYSLQYYLLLRFFGIDAPFIPAMSAIASIYLLQTSIPLPPLWDLIVRGNIAIYIWSFFSTNELSILAATFGLWILNLIVPSLVGLVLILNTNVIKSLGYEKNNN